MSGILTASLSNQYALILAVSEVDLKLIKGRRMEETEVRLRLFVLVVRF